MGCDRDLYINNSHEEGSYIWYAYDVLRAFKEGGRVVLLRRYYIIGH